MTSCGLIDLPAWPDCSPRLWNMTNCGLIDLPAWPDSSHRLWNMTAQAITNVCPASSPFTPARMLMAFVQKTTSITMYT